VEEPVLLREFRPEEHPDLDVTSGDAREACSDRRHQLLGCKAIADGLLETQGSWFSHS
jgi:hypothetical protein